MHCHHNATTGLDNLVGKTLILVGNPNVGKSLIFAHLTGRYVEVSNFPGTTVEVTRGQARFGENTISVIDTPGINSLLPRSEDERVTRQLLLAEPNCTVIQVADAKNLRRALLLTTQLAEMHLPMMLVLNMQDEALLRGIHIDVGELSRRLGIEVISTTATRGDGLAHLLPAVIRARVCRCSVAYETCISEALEQVKAFMPATAPRSQAFGIMALASDEGMIGYTDQARAQLNLIRDQLAEYYQIPVAYALNQQRLRCVECIMQGVYSQNAATGRGITDRLGQISIHPIWGWPILATILFILYQFVGVFGAGTLVGFFEKTLFGEWINPFITTWIDRLLPFPLLRDFLVGQYGLVTMALSYGIAIVLPIVTTFFIAFSLLEDSGYLPRLAIMLNRPFKAMGLNGKAVLPMVLGLGCDTMATMTTRILETRKDRIVTTLLLALGVPCSAQLGVILGMISYISPIAMALWAGIVILVMLTVGWLGAKIMPGEASDFILEMPPIRLPRPQNIAFKTLARLEWYLREVLPLFILGTATLFLLDVTGALKWIEGLMSPLVVDFLGLPKEAAAAFLIGFLRRDYGAAGLFQMAQQGAMTEAQMLVSLVVITLFIPCIANVLMIVKEYGSKTAISVAAVVFPLAFAVGGTLNWLIRLVGAF